MLNYVLMYLTQKRRETLK